MKIFTVVGARPQFVKAAVVSRKLAATSPQNEEVLVHTGQHYDTNMSQVFFDELKLPLCNHNLGIGGGTHGQNTGRMIEKLEHLMLVEKPDWVLVYGDTDSTLAGALAAAKIHIPIAHVESGLRSYNRRMPEEQNRVLTDHLSSILFVPTEAARTNLLREGIDESRMKLVGDVMLDACLFYKSRARKPTWFEQLGFAADKFVLCTIHRAENTDDFERMQQILEGLGSSELAIVLPIHPRTRKKLQDMNLSLPPNVSVVDPVGYLEMIWLETNCKLIVTDSGGVQKEAYFYGKPCITVRDETEWIELVTCGANRLTGANKTKISEALLAQPVDLISGNLYGDGTAGAQIVDALLSTDAKELVASER